MSKQITILIHRVQSTTIEVRDDFDLTGDLDGQLEHDGSWDYLSARLHEDTHLVSLTALPEPAPVCIGDPYVIVEGGLVQNNPLLPVFNLDLLDADFVDESDVDYAIELAQTVRTHGLSDIADRLEAFAAEHEHLRGDHAGS
jgi:hypothetical protein